MEKPNRRAGPCSHWCGWRYVTFAGLEQKMGDCQGCHRHYGWQ